MNGARSFVEVTLGRTEYNLMTRGAARLLGFTESAAEIDGVRVPFLVRGWGPPIVLVHGFGADKESWLLLASALRARGRSILIPDLPGFGAAGAIPAERASAKWQARAVAGLLDRLGYSRAHLVGNSMGGGVSLRFAQDYPERLTSMSLLCSVGPLVVKSELNLALDRGENLLLLESADDMDRLLGFVFASPPKTSRAIRAYLAKERFARRDAQAALFRGWIDPNEGEGIPENLESIRTPTLVIHGLKDRLIHPSTGEALAARIPGARLELLEGIGHGPQLEAPRQVGKLVGDFVEAAEARYADRQRDAVAAE
jgi:abhydrolase domain-containing protein 6